MNWFNNHSNRNSLSRKYYTKNFFSSLSLSTKLIIFNILFFVGFYIIFLIMGTTPENYSVLLRNIALQPLNILEGKKLWTLLTHMFMHAGISHLFMNMVSMIFLGGFVEKLIGKKRFLWLYIVGGLMSAIFFATLAGFFGGTVIGEKLFGSPLTFAVGASGAIFALGGLLAVLIPKMKVLVFFVIPMPMWIAMSFFMGFFWILSYTAGIPIGNSAHFGGLVVGLAYGAYIRKRYPRKTKMISRMFS